MGRGDKKTAKGKRAMGSHGNTRPKTKKSNATIPSAKPEAVTKIKKEITPKKSPVKKSTKKEEVK